MKSDDPERNPVFATTCWTEVLQAGRPGSPEADRAMAEVCRTYWYPLYAYARRLGNCPSDAQDLTQEFFARLLEKNYVGTADRTRGKFRWFLLTAFKCFLANEYDRAHAKKRGGATVILSLDQEEAEHRYHMEPGPGLSPDQIYDRRWALDLLERSRMRIRTECPSPDKLDRLRQLEVFLGGAQTTPSHAETAARLGVSEPAVRQEVHRLRKRFGEIIREEVSRTVIQPGDVDEELRHLLDIVGRFAGAD